MGKVIQFQKRQRKLKNGTFSIYLDYHIDGVRKYKFIKTKLNSDSSNLRVVNKEIEIEKSNIISMYDDSPNWLEEEIDFVSVLKDDYSNYQKRGKRNFKSAISKFEQFLDESGIDQVFCKNLNDKFFLEFKVFLENKFSKETCQKYFRFIKKSVLGVFEDGLVSVNPFNVKSYESRSKWCFRVDKHQKNKEVLSANDLKLLYKTPCKNQVIKDAFLFCCYTGLGFQEIKELTWSNIDFEEGVLTYSRAKNQKQVVLPIKKMILEILGNYNQKSDYVFSLPSITTFNKNIQDWVDAANINKHITSYCARHTFGTLLIKNNDISIVQTLMGHSFNSTTTMKYLHWNPSNKLAAINGLPSF